MKKLLLSVAMLVGASSVLPVVASVDSMYNDIMGSIVNASLVKTDQERLYKLEIALCELHNSKRYAEMRLLNAHGDVKNIDMQMFGAFLAGSSAFVLLAPIVDPSCKIAEALALGGYLVFVSAGIFAEKTVKCYFAKKKLAELNEVIAKLETAKAELENKMATEQQEPSAPVEQYA